MQDAVPVGVGGTTVRLKSTAAWGGGAYVLVSVIQPRDPASTPKPRRKDVNQLAETIRTAVRRAADMSWGKKPIVKVTVAKV